MPDPQMTPEQLQRLADQQKKFNDQLEKTRDLLDNIEEIDGSIANQLKKQVDAASALNIKYGIGKDVLSKATKLQEEAEVKINILQQDRDRLLKKYTKARTQAAKDEIEEQLRLVTAQIKFNRSLEENIRLVQTAAEEEARSTEEKKKQLEYENQLGEKLKRRFSLTKSIYGEFATLSTYIISAGFKANQQIIDLGKSLGISESSARDLRNSFQQYVKTTQDGFTNVQRLVKAQLELTEQLGFAAKFSREELETYSRLTEIIGLSTQEAGNLAKFSASTGTSTKNYVADIRKSAFYAQQANKIHISDKELLSTVSKLSTGILTKFQGNPKALAEAVVQAKKLGTSLEQIDKIGDSLLDWESSIQNELEAELITGRQLNFERARAAALTGDQAELMQEMVNQAGSLAEYENMNVIARQSLAKAFGLTNDEMADMLMKQEAIAKYGDKAAELNKEQLDYMQRNNLSAEQMLDKVNNQRSAQEKFNDAMTRFQDLVGGIVEGPLGKFVSLMAKILSYSEAQYALMGLYIARLGTSIALKIVEYNISRKNAAANITGAAAEAAKSAAAIPVIGWGLAAAAALAIAGTLYGLANKSPQEVEDGVAMPGRGPFTITDSFGATAITAAGDGIAVSPNINKGDGVMNAINNLANILTKQPTPQFALNVSGEQIGAVVGKQQSTGTQQTINSYKLA